MVEVKVESLGDLRTRCVHGPSGSTLRTDAPVDNKGRGELFSPTDLIATGLGACILTVIDIAAQARGWSTAGSRARVTKVMSQDRPRRIGELLVELTLAGEFPHEAVETLRHVAEECPVRSSLHPEIRVVTSIATSDGRSGSIQ